MARAQDTPAGRSPERTEGELHRPDEVRELLAHADEVAWRIPLNLWAPETAPSKRLPLMPWQDDPTVETATGRTADDALEEYDQFADDVWELRDATVTLYADEHGPRYDADVRFARDKEVGVPSSDQTLQVTATASYTATLPPGDRAAVAELLHPLDDGDGDDDRPTYGITWTGRGYVKD